MSSLPSEAASSPMSPPTSDTCAARDAAAAANGSKRKAQNHHFAKKKQAKSASMTSAQRKSRRLGPKQHSAIAGQVALALMLAIFQVRDAESPEERERICSTVVSFAAERWPPKDRKGEKFREAGRALAAAVEEDCGGLAQEDEEGTTGCRCHGCDTACSNREELIDHYMVVHAAECPGYSTMVALLPAPEEEMVDVEGGGTVDHGFPTVVAHTHKTEVAAPTSAAGAAMSRGRVRKLGWVKCPNCPAFARRDAVRLADFWMTVKDHLYGDKDTTFHEFLSRQAVGLLLRRLGRTWAEIAEICHGLCSDEGAHIIIPGELFLGTSKTARPAGRWANICNPAWPRADGKSYSVGTLSALTLRVARSDVQVTGSDKSLEHDLVSCGGARFFVLEGTLKRFEERDEAHFHPSVVSSVVSVEEPHRSGCTCLV